MTPSVRITAVVTAYRRIERTLATLEKLRACDPTPEEILVHVDGNQARCERAIHRAFPEIKIMVSQESVGPGGGRNKLVAAARNEIVASFDDDSYPIDADYFARVQGLFEQFPDASILSAAIYERGQPIGPDAREAAWVSDFSGCACAYRRADFLATAGYVPLPIAYGMEEVDLALRLHSQGCRILRTASLRVFHDTDLGRHASPVITAGSVANIALLAYLRYPPFYWPVGLGQVCNRVRWLITHGRRTGICSGLASTPRHCWRHRHFRQVVSRSSIRSYLNLRRKSVPVHLT